MKQRNPSNGGTQEEPPFFDDVDSNCSTPYVSAPSSPGRMAPPCASSGYFFSAPASPVHYVLSSAAGNVVKTSSASPELLHPGGGSFEFGGAGPSGPMISADELFLNGQIRPLKLSSHLQRPQALAPLIDLEEEDEQEGENGGRGREVTFRSRSIHRRARSMSPMRSRYQWEAEDEDETAIKDQGADVDVDVDPKHEDPVTPSASSSRFSSGRNSKRWIFLKDLLYRSKSEGRARDSNGKEKEKYKLWHLSPAKEKSSSLKKKGGNPNPHPNVNGVSNGVGGRRVPTAHERHYTANRAQAEEMRRRTFLPYRQGLLGCLGFSSRGYGAVNGFARTLNPVSSR